MSRDTQKYLFDDLCMSHIFTVVVGNLSEFFQFSKVFLDGATLNNFGCVYLTETHAQYPISKSKTAICFFKWHPLQMVYVGLCTLLMKLNISAIFIVIPKDNRRVQSKFLSNIEKFTLFHRLLDCLSFLELLRGSYYIQF